MAHWTGHDSEEASETKEITSYLCFYHIILHFLETDLGFPKQKKTRLGKLHCLFKLQMPLFHFLCSHFEGNVTFNLIF